MERVWVNLYESEERKNKASRKPTLSAGDRVRISKARRIFSKGYRGRWSKEIFTVKKPLRTTPVTYVIEDAGGDELRGSFYERELQRVIPPTYFDIETILDSRKGKGGKREYLVKWSGYPASFNSWTLGELVKMTKR